MYASTGDTPVTVVFTPSSPDSSSGNKGDPALISHLPSASTLCHAPSLLLWLGSEICYPTWLFFALCTLFKGIAIPALVQFIVATVAVGGPILSYLLGCVTNRKSGTHGAGHGQFSVSMISIVAWAMVLSAYLTFEDDSSLAPVHSCNTNGLDGGHSVFVFTVHCVQWTLTSVLSILACLRYVHLRLCPPKNCRCE